MPSASIRTVLPLAATALALGAGGTLHAQVPADAPYLGVGGKPVAGAEILFDGTRQMLDEKWTYWQGPRFASALPIKWKIVDDPVDRGGKVLQSDDPATKTQQYGSSDIVTKKTYRDFRLHIEFRCGYWGANSGVYLQNRYELQVLDGDATMHGIGSLVNETPSPYWLYKGTGTWNAYDVQFRAARFKDGKLIEKAMVTMYFNGIKILQNQAINKVWGGANSGLDGGNDNGFGITDTPGGLKLQNEAHDVRFRNIWIREMDFPTANTNF